LGPPESHASQVDHNTAPCPNPDELAQVQARGAINPQTEENLEQAVTQPTIFCLSAAIRSTYRLLLLETTYGPFFSRGGYVIIGFSGLFHVFRARWNFDVIKSRRD